MTAEQANSQRQRIIEFLQERGMARLSEIVATGVTAAAVSRLEREGSITRLSRGLYQLPDAALDQHQRLAEAAKLIPKGVICLASALAYHELTDYIPRRVWIAIGPKDWKPQVSYPPIRTVRFSTADLTRHIETHDIEGVPVRITNPARTVVDLFRYRSKIGQNLAIEGLRETLRTRKATPAEIQAIAAGARQWRHLQPYLEAIVHNG